MASSSAALFGAVVLTGTLVSLSRGARAAARVLELASFLAVGSTIHCTLVFHEAARSGCVEKCSSHDRVVRGLPAATRLLQSCRPRKAARVPRRDLLGTAG